MTLPLIQLGEVDSTQSFLARHPELGCCGVEARVQTAGRGQGTNRWEGAPGQGLYLSARLPLPDLPAGLLLQKAMAAVAEALRPWYPDLGLKWPNDLVAHRGEGLVKLGGIIGEVRAGTILLGLGVNLAGAPSIPERTIPPACLGDFTERPLPESAVLARELLGCWQRLGETRSPAFLWPIGGTPILWEDGQGICLGWEPDGRLKVAIHGQTRLLTSGDLSGLRQG